MTILLGSKENISMRELKMIVACRISYLRRGICPCADCAAGKEKTWKCL